jgi:hypothetical protein
LKNNSVAIRTHRSSRADGIDSETFSRFKIGFRSMAGRSADTIRDSDSIGKQVRQIGFSWEMRKGRRRLPPVPLPTVALEPEQQVGPAVTTTGIPREVVVHICCRQCTTPR